MAELASLEHIEGLYAARGGLHYGEGVTQTEHAVQCAALARAGGASPGLVAAALLHDIGHLLAEADAASLRTDDRHEAVGARALRKVFGEAVCAPIALHVAAKRYLCFKSATYLDALSLASQKSLQLQGGPFDLADADAFERQPYWREALVLRRFDDMGKQEEISGLAFAEFAPLLRPLWTGN